MNIALSWDLFIVAFFAIIIAYSFIIGKNNTVKIILGTYVAALSADAAGNLFGIYFSHSAAFLKLIHMMSPGSGPESSAAMIKLLLFVVVVIVMSVRGGFTVNSDIGKSTTSRLVMTGFFGFLSAGLIIGTVLMYVSGLSFIAGASTAEKISITSFTGQSPLVQTLINFYNYWFLLPALALIFGGILAGREGE
ncbi:MAG: hypothetical protein WCT36_04405 [Candidatus Gracilibacteria bacterium]